MWGRKVIESRDGLRGFQDRVHGRYVTMPVCTMFYISQYRYAPRSIRHNTGMHHALYVTMPVCTMFYTSQCRYAPCLICHNAGMHYVLCHNASIHHVLYVTMPVCTMFYTSQRRYAPCSIRHNVECTMFYMSLCRMHRVLYFTMLNARCCRCHNAGMHHLLYVTTPVCTMFFIPQKESRCNPDPNPKHVHE